MKTPRIMALLFGAAIAIGACADSDPTSPSTYAVAYKQDKADKPEKAAERTALLTNVPVTGALLQGSAAAGSFAGSFTAKRFDIDATTRALSMTGVLNGTATLLDGSVVAIIDQQFTTLANLSGAGAAGAAGIMRPVSSVACETTDGAVVATPVAFRQVQASCDVLFLDLGPLSLDLLGLTVDLSQVVLDVNAVTGPGNLLGNLLCALLGLLDIAGLLTTITQLLETINNILAGLNPGGLTGASFETPIAVPMAGSQSA